MIGLGLRQLQDALNRQADTVQREFIAVSERLKVIGQRLVESRETEHERLLAEQQELRLRQREIAAAVNVWRERAREAALKGEGDELRAYLDELWQQGEESVRPAIEQVRRLLDAPPEERARVSESRAVARAAMAVGRLIERARIEYDLRGADPGPRQRAAVEFSNRPGMAQDEAAILAVEAGMDDPDPMVREVALLTTIQLHRFRAMRLADLEAAHESVKRLARINHPAVIPALIEILATPRSGFVQAREARNGNSRLVALTRLIEWHTAAAQAAVQARQFDLDPNIVRVAVRALELFPGEWFGPLETAGATRAAEASR